MGPRSSRSTSRTNTAGTPIHVGAAPLEIAITPDGGTAYVVNADSDDVTPIDIATNTPGPSIPVGDTPFDIAITPDGATAYVVNQISNNVTPINLATRTPGTPIPSEDPQGIAITPDQAPVARFLVTPAAAGSATTFDASASTVAFGTIASYAWNFGDGTTATTTTAVTTHTYQTAGTYTVSVTETSSAGTSTTRVFTGQTVSRNGGPQAIADGTVVIPAATGGTTTTTSAGGGGTTTPVTLPATGGGAANGTLVTMALVLLALGVALIARSRRHPA